MAVGQSEAVLNRPRGLACLGMAAEASDSQLLTRFMADRGESAQAAFATLVRRHAAMVLRVCQQVVGDRHSAEDAFQATFMILARRAGSIRQPELLGNWLHGVAVRTAREARMRDVRRRRRETPAGPTIDRAPIDDDWGADSTMIRREEFEVIHSEVARLPERYRGPVVLCDLEGLTHQQAAQQLNCPVGTIGVRLKRARQRLREQLTRRGVVPSVGVMAAVLGTDNASALTSPSLIDSTIEAGIEFAASTGTYSLSRGAGHHARRRSSPDHGLGPSQVANDPGACGRDNRNSRLDDRRPPPIYIDTSCTNRCTAAGRTVPFAHASVASHVDYRAPA